MSLRPLNDAVRGAVRSLLSNAPTSPGKVRFAWAAVVGPALERATTVRLEGDTLIVEATTAQWAREVSRSTPVILRRLQSYLGEGVVNGMSVRTSSQCPEARSQKPGA